MKRTINQTMTTSNYPYGFLRTTAIFSLEFNPKKGQRLVFQTVNPKNGRLNAPKKATYDGHGFSYLEQDENGIIKSHCIDLRRPEGIETLVTLLNESPELIEELTEEQIKYYLHFIYATVKHFIEWTPGSIYLLEELKPTLDTIKLNLNIGDLKTLIAYFTINKKNFAELRVKYPNEKAYKSYTVTTTEYNFI